MKANLRHVSASWRSARCLHELGAASTVMNTNGPEFCCMAQATTTMLQKWQKKGIHYRRKKAVSFGSMGAPETSP